MNNHIALLRGYIEELMSLARVQLLIDTTRRASPTCQELQLAMDRRQAELDEARDRVHEKMFEISQNN